MTKLQEMLIRHEEKRLFLYRCTSGKLTIGVGHNIEDNGLTDKVVMMILDDDITEAVKQLHFHFHWFQELDNVRQDALIDMVFNLGIGRFLSFKKTISALSAGDYNNAAAEMLQSQWVQQVGNRAVELSEMVRTGEYQ
jgi:lysozyme